MTTSGKVAAACGVLTALIGIAGAAVVADSSVARTVWLFLALCGAISTVAQVVAQRQ